MLRPESFQQSHVAFRNTPYLRETAFLLQDASPALATPGPAVADETLDAARAYQPCPHPAGVLSKGQIVWTRSHFALGGMPARTVAFVEELGLISLDPRWLVPTDTGDCSDTAIPIRTPGAPQHLPMTVRRVS